MPRKAQPLPFPKGTLVRYYDWGWRAGYFEGIEKGRALILPIGPVGKQMRHISIDLSDMKRADES